jgi:hypothetical protein
MRVNRPHLATLCTLALLAGPIAAQENRWPIGAASHRHLCGKALAASAMSQSLTSQGRPFAGDPGAAAAYREAYPDTDVLDNNLDLEFVLSPQRMRGSNTMTVRSLVDGLTEFSIILHPNYAATALLNGATPGAMTTFGTWGRRITLDRAYQAGEVFTVRIDYDGTPPPPLDFGGLVIRTRSGSPEIWTLSQPFAAGCWWPCKDGDYGLGGDNSDKATLSLAVTGPSSMRTTANGMLLGVDDLGDGRSRTRFRTEYPLATYLACFASTNFNTWTRTWTYDGKSMPVEFNLYSETYQILPEPQAGNILAMLTVFSDLFGPYPFIDEKYGIYQFGFGGGMEHQTNTGQYALDGGWLSAHELAHQWWGDNVTCKDWSHIWLNEGFATYSEALWEEFRPGSTGKPALLTAMAARRPTNSAGSVFVENTSFVNTIFDSSLVYDKGGWVLHMLRFVVGDDNFFAGLRAYRQTHERGSVVTEDLQATFEAVSGMDLDAFFQQWIYGTGTPTYRANRQNVTVNGRNYIRVYFTQTQTQTYGYQSMFRMPVELRLGVATASPRVRIFNDARAEWFLIPVNTFPDGLVIDPDSRILTSSVNSTAWVPGPAKVVETLPPPGASLSAAANTSTMRLWFSDAVSIDASKVTLIGPSGPVPVTVEFDAPSFLATVSFPPLAVGGYTLTLSEQITASGKLLDGEVADPASPASLPSGEGLPGGNAVISFSVRCAADVDRDDDVTLDDFFAFLGAWDTQSPAADIDGNGVIELEDFFAFFGAFDTGC